MPVDFTAPEGATIREPQDSMFAPTPLWERDRKARRRAPRATTAASPVEPSTSAPAPRNHRRAMLAGAVIGGAVAAVALGGLGWYASQAHDRGVAELTPGEAQIALSTGAPPAVQAPATSSSAAEPPAATAPQPEARPAAPAHRSGADSAKASSPAPQAQAKRTPRVRPAEPSSALGAGMDAATTAPMVSTPQPAPSAAPAPPAPVDPLLTTPAPAPAPATTMPPTGPIEDSAAPTAARTPSPQATP